ncbi:NAD-binding protein [Lunatibacter salilacus]|uniref:NAD-binding protein n=1 Tax=Lunatibacter salilacus TaxID=2483804 RepID=UPI00131B7DB9|nr:NAD-binding protein [Lunatibacter salilacus]
MLPHRAMIYLTSKNLKTQLKDKTVISHSGHRDLLSEDFQTIREKVRGKLKEIVKGNPNKFILITGFAEGADELVAEVAVGLGISVVLLVIDKESFPAFDQEDLERIGKIESKKNLFIYKLGANQSTSNRAPYEILCDLLVSHSTHLIALWDGVDTGKIGGTSEVVKSFRERANQKGEIPGILFHLFTPRISNETPNANLYIDHLILPRKKYDWETSTFDNVKKSGKKTFKYYSDFIYRFGIPILLASIVFIIGWKGYLIDNNNINTNGNAFFFAANLITLNESVFPNPVSSWTKTARVFGAGLAAYGFGLAFYFALGKENFHRLRFWFYRIFNSRFSVVIGLNEVAYDIIQDLRRNKPYQSKSRVVVLSQDINTPYTSLARNEGAWIISGIPSDSISLQKTYFHRAERVFVVTGSEEENVRCVMEMDQVASKGKKPITEDWFVHIQDRTLRQLLQQSISARTNYALTVFSHADNTARRMLAGLPELRSPSLTTSIAIVGFGAVGKALVLKSVLQLVFTKTPVPKIVVFYTENETKAVEDFKSEYSYLFPTSVQGIEGPFKKLTDWTFFDDQGSESISDRILFFQLPMIHQHLSHPQSPLLANVFNEGKLKVFACLNTGLESASFLTAVLPGLEGIKLQQASYDIQAYCFYNFPDEEEEAYLEQKLNALAPHIPVKCFGNYLYEFSCNAIQNREADHLAKQIAFWYYLLYDYGSGPESVRRSIEIDERFSKIILEINNLQKGFLSNDTKASNDDVMKLKIEGLEQLWHHALTDNQLLGDMQNMMRYCWKSLSETDREGNRQAADHLWVKVTEFNKSWSLSEKPSDIQHFQKFWAENEIEDLGLVEHRRWNMMKILDGWRPFDGKDWEIHKENYKAQKLHNLLVPFRDLPQKEQIKDIHQIEGIPFFIGFLSRCLYNQNIQF